MKARIDLGIDGEVDFDAAINWDSEFRGKLEQNISDLLSSYFLKRVSVKLNPVCKGFSSYDPAEYISPSFAEIEYK